eukprot:scaffold253315_cov35-Tisochrysis_lutea.AAC.1
MRCAHASGGSARLLVSAATRSADWCRACRHRQNAQIPRAQMGTVQPPPLPRAPAAPHLQPPRLWRRPPLGDAAGSELFRPLPPEHERRPAAAVRPRALLGEPEAPRLPLAAAALCPLPVREELHLQSGRDGGPPELPNESSGLRVLGGARESSVRRGGRER